MQLVVLLLLTIFNEGAGNSFPQLAGAPYLANVYFALKLTLVKLNAVHPE